MGCNQHMNIVEECRQQLNHVMEFSCDKLHNSIREFIFQRIDYSKVDSLCHNGLLIVELVQN